MNHSYFPTIAMVIAIVRFSISTDFDIDSIIKTNILTLFEINDCIDVHIQNLNNIDL